MEKSPNFIFMSGHRDALRVDDQTRRYRVLFGDLCEPYEDDGEPFSLMQERPLSLHYLQLLTAMAEAYDGTWRNDVPPQLRDMALHVCDAWAPITSTTKGTNNV